MLFRYTEIENNAPKTLQDAVSVSKCPTLRICLYPTAALLLVAAGVLILLLQPIKQYLVSSMILFIVALVPVLFLFDALFFRMMIGKGAVVLRKLASKETVYAYTDVSWKFQNPKGSRSAILVYAKNKTVARILPGAKGYGAVLSLRHKGGLTKDEKELLRKVSSSPNQ